MYRNYFFYIKDIGTHIFFYQDCAARRSFLGETMIKQKRSRQQCFHQIRRWSCLVVGIRLHDFGMFLQVFNISLHSRFYINLPRSVSVRALPAPVFFFFFCLNNTEWYIVRATLCCFILFILWLWSVGACICVCVCVRFPFVFTSLRHVFHWSERREWKRRKKLPSTWTRGQFLFLFFKIKKKGREIINFSGCRQLVKKVWGAICCVCIFFWTCFSFSSFWFVTASVLQS